MKSKNYFYKNLAKSMNYEKDIFYQSLFKLKYDKMEQEIELLEKKRDKLKECYMIYY